jgi:hypothetical protein
VPIQYETVEQNTVKRDLEGQEANIVELHFDVLFFKPCGFLVYFCRMRFERAVLTNKIIIAKIDFLPKKIRV